MPKKTIYIRDTDMPLWEQAESLATGESVSAILTEALQQYLEGFRPVYATIKLRGASLAFRARVHPASGGWLVAISEKSDMARAMSEAQIVLPQNMPTKDDAWLWLAPHQIDYMFVELPSSLGSMDFREYARRAWPILVKRLFAQQTLTYGELGELLGGLHPYRQVPQVLDIIEKWCLEHGYGDLTAMVVSKTTGLPGTDYWQQNGWAGIPVAEQVERWKKAQQQMIQQQWPEEAPF
ncbi:MAG: hypothetical protein C7B47_11245 [Sulfobacillus thermosulfidooxidans]|uniref:Uncharacterized protein n=1 Tax=Sulfobacillus thermosulfidooxidans TaxID=28034 RepID=A0A2T2WU80_SULTH|nr:MAG: hypothetical protein C7B47_11245 [Sulfobacillus thermosulfidooxidans]